MRRLIAVLVASLLALVVSTGVAAAHAKLESMTPADGSTMAAPPTKVVLTFNEDVNPDFVAVKVTGPEGSESAGKPAVDGTAVTQSLAADLPAGKHTVTYRVVSTDGHPVSGTVTFTSTAAPASASPSPTASPTASATPTPSPTASVVASPEPTVTAEPASQESDGGATPWLVVGAVILLAVLGLGTAWRTIGGRKAEAEADAADVADDDPEPPAHGRTPTA